RPGTASAPRCSALRWSRCSIVLSLSTGGAGLLGDARTGIVMLLAHAPLLLVAVQVDAELAIVPLSTQLLHVGVELLLRDDDHVEQHVRVALAALLGALALVAALTGRDDLEARRVLWEHVILVEEVDYPEGMDDVAGVEAELDGLVDGEPQLGQRIR